MLYLVIADDRAVAVDHVHGFVFWSGTETISRAQLDGTDNHIIIREAKYSL